MEKEEILPNSFYEARITLTPKLGKIQPITLGHWKKKFKKIPEDEKTSHIHELVGLIL